MAEMPKAESVPPPPSIRPASAAAKIKVSSVPSPKTRPTSAPSSSPASSPRVSAIKGGTTASRGIPLRSSIQSPSTPPPSSASSASDSAGPSRTSSSPRTLQRQPSTGPVPSSEGNASRSPRSTPSTLKRQSSSSLSTSTGVRAATGSTTSVRSKAMAASSSSSPSTSASNAATSSAARKATATQALANRKLARQQQQQQGKGLSSSLPPPPTAPPTATSPLVRTTSSSTSGARSSLPSPSTTPSAPSTTSASGTPPRRSSTLNTSSSSSSSPVIRRKAPAAASPSGPPPTAAVRRVTLDLSSSMGEQVERGDGGAATTATKSRTPADDATLSGPPSRADKPMAGSATSGGQVGEQPSLASAQLPPVPPPDKVQVEEPVAVPPRPPISGSHADANHGASKVDLQARATDRQGSLHRHSDVSEPSEPAKAAEAPRKDAVTRAAVEVAQEEGSSGLDGEIMGYRRLVTAEEQHLIRWQDGLDEWIDSEALMLEFPEEMEAYEKWRREQGARGRPPCSGCKEEKDTSTTAQREGEDDDVSVAQIENLGLIAARVLDSVRSLLHDSERTSLEAAALRQCASDFTRKKDWMDGDVLLYALDHGMAAPAAAPHGLVERARWIIEMLTTPQLVAALQSGQILSADLAADPQGTAVKNRLLDMQRLQIRVRNLHNRLGDVEDHILKLRRRRRDLEDDVAELEEVLAAQEGEG